MASDAAIIAWATSLALNPATSRIQVPIQRVKVDTAAHWLVPIATAMRQKAGSRPTPASPRNCTPKGSGSVAALRSGTTK